MRRWTFPAVAFAAATALGIGLVQAHPHSQGHHGERFAHGNKGERPGDRTANRVAAIEQRLAALKGELKITPEQEPAWNAYVDEAKRHASEMHAQRNAIAANAPKTAPERAELRSQMAKKRQEHLEKAAALTRSLYDVLTPEQKALADQRLAGGRHLAMGRR